MRLCHFCTAAHNERFSFTSESVSEGHPDKVADQISDAVLDAILAQDKHGRVAAETLVATGLVVMAGQITTSAKVNYGEIARDIIKRIGYDDLEIGFDYRSCAVLTAYDAQSADIAQGVDEGKGLDLDQGAGDQGLMFGFRVRRDAATDAGADLLRAPPDGAPRRAAQGRPPAVAAPRRQVAGHRALRRRQADPGRHRRDLDPAPPGRHPRADRGSGDRGNRQAGVPEEHAEGPTPNT